MASDTTGTAPTERFHIILPWGMRVSLYVDDGRPWLDVVDEDDGSGASTALTPEALRLLVEHAAPLAGRTVVELPAPDKGGNDAYGRHWLTFARGDVEFTISLNQAEPMIRSGYLLKTIEQTETFALRLLSVAQRARRLASESSGAGEPRG